MLYTVGIYIFDEAEVLDFAGPFEVFSTASRVQSRLQPDTPPAFEVFLIADTTRLVRARGGFMVQPHYNITNHPAIDVLIVPGGVVTAELERAEITHWIGRIAASSGITASVCTGSFLLAQAGLLQNRRATTHWEDIGDLRAMFPEVKVETETRWIDTGPVVTSAGISAGIDMSLHLVARLAGDESAIKTARQMEYDWKHTRL